LKARPIGWIILLTPFYGSGGNSCSSNFAFAHMNLQFFSWTDVNVSHDCGKLEIQPSKLQEKTSAWSFMQRLHPLFVNALFLYFFSKAYTGVFLLKDQIHSKFVHVCVCGCA
jgi:hypothetical protein